MKCTCCLVAAFSSMENKLIFFLYLVAGFNAVYSEFLDILLTFCHLNYIPALSKHLPFSVVFYVS